jgi:hypothetical protein
MKVTRRPTMGKPTASFKIAFAEEPAPLTALVVSPARSFNSMMSDGVPVAVTEPALGTWKSKVPAKVADPTNELTFNEPAPTAVRLAGVTNKDATPLASVSAVVAGLKRSSAASAAKVTSFPGTAAPAESLMVAVAVTPAWGTELVATPAAFNMPTTMVAESVVVLFPVLPPTVPGLPPPPPQATNSEVSANPIQSFNLCIAIFLIFPSIAATSNVEFFYRAAPRSVIILGVMNTNISCLVAVRARVLNRLPTAGKSPKNGTLVSFSLS